MNAALDCGARAALVIDEAGVATFGTKITKSALVDHLQKIVHSLLHQLGYEQQLVQELQAKLAAPTAVQDLVAGPDEKLE